MKKARIFRLVKTVPSALSGLENKAAIDGIDPLPGRVRATTLDVGEKQLAEASVRLSY
jgi:hypothetical protein